ncbi:cytosolic sulfotransferase 3-like [Betta splendens]|uniref:Sulfotransferase n=1 Tax=Betta splendens TaxID=158456 RepID=A0A6P7N0B2_BETSP|nr:cytosolic sulfotransferase 3-like [Betta splendens]
MMLDAGICVRSLELDDRNQQMELPPRPTLFDFRGVSMTTYFTDNWDNVQRFQARPDDVLIATYPKAGNTWVSYILDLLYFSHTAEGRDSVPLFERVPFLELYVPGFPIGVDELNELTRKPRLIKTHLPVQFLPRSFWEQNSKIVYVARNAKDTAVSYFHFDRMNLAQPEPGDWSSFLHRFMQGKMVFGSWYEHVKGWWQKKQSGSNILYLFYEDLIEDTERELGALCSFLGLAPTAALTEAVMKEALFDSMKRNALVNGSTATSLDLNVSPFIRKGKVGDWKNHFTVEQNEQFDEDYGEKMTNTDLQFRTVL